MLVSINYGANPRQITLKFNINSDTNVPNAREYKLLINNTTSSAKKDLDFDDADLEGTRTLVFTFNDTAQFEHTSNIQEIDIYREGIDESGVPSVNWVNNALKNIKLEIDNLNF